MSADQHKLLRRQLRRHFPNGVPEGMEGFLAEINLTYHQADDNHKLLERALDLSSVELIDQNEALQEEMERLDSFIYRVSHDLKAPVNNVLSMVSLLEDQLPEDAKLGYQAIGHVRKASQGMLKQLQDLLELSRMKNKIDEVPEEVDLGEMVQEIWEAMSHKVRETNAELVTDFGAGFSLMIGRENLRSLLQNLMGNALKYHSPERRPEITVRARAGDSQVYLTISDNGLGIDLKRFGEKLFGMFNRFHSHVEGSGVGLFIVKQIVEAHAGSIAVDSAPGEGTTFNLTMELIREPAARPSV